MPLWDNVVLMEDVFGQGKDVMGSTTVATIPMKPTAVCLYCGMVVVDCCKSSVRVQLNNTVIYARVPLKMFDGVIFIIIINYYNKWPFVDFKMPCFFCINFEA